jgi:hypothetical protein
MISRPRTSVLRAMAMLSCLALFAACTDIGSGSADDEASEEPPFFVADRHATGPLTLDELQIDIPDDVERWMNDSKKACFFAAVERRAIEAGDPADIDPDDFPYWGGEVSREDWSGHSTYMQRVLLAQAVISWAMMDC